MLHKFNFRAPTQSQIKDNQDKGLPAPIHRDSVEVELNLLTIENIESILFGSDAKAIELLLSQVNQVLIDEVRNQIDAMPNYEQVNVESIDWTKVDFIKIANQPKATRGFAPAFTPEQFEAFKLEFVEVLTNNTSVNEETANKVLTLLESLKRLANTPVALEKLNVYVETYLTYSSDKELDVVANYFKGRIQSYLNKLENVDVLASLGI